MLKKICAALAVVGTSAFALADDTVTHLLPQTDSANGIEAFQTLLTDLTAWSGKFLPICLGVVGVFLVYWLIKFGLRVFKSFAGSGK